MNKYLENKVLGFSLAIFSTYRRETLSHTSAGFLSDQPNVNELGKIVYMILKTAVLLLFKLIHKPLHVINKYLVIVAGEIRVTGMTGKWHED